MNKVSADWVAKWPDSQLAWHQRREALVMTHSHSAELWKQADENLIRLSPPHTMAGMAAYDWVTAGVNLADAEALVTSEIAWRDAQPRPALPAAPSLSDMVAQTNSSSSLFAPLCTLATAQTKLKEFAAAHATIARINRWLDNDFKQYFDSDPLEAYPDYEAKYPILSAELAQAEGKKADALAFYQRVITNPYYRREYSGYIGQTRYLWDQLVGGTDGGR
jgi:hypothetical protein